MSSPAAWPEGMSPAPCPPRNSRGRNTRNEAQPSPASQGETQPGTRCGSCPADRACPGTRRRAGAMETPPTPIAPVPGTARSGTPLSPEEAQPGTVPGHLRDNPLASQPRLGPGSNAEGIAPSLRRTPPTPTPTNTRLWNTGLPGGFPAPQGRGGMRLRSPAARGPGGETPAASGPR